MGRGFLIAAFLAAARMPGEAAAEGPRFVERAAELLIDHRYEGGWEHFVGGGVAAFDCDGDHLPELYAAGGARPAALLRNRSALGGALEFVEATPDPLALTDVAGAYPLDVDGDGAMDLVVLRVGENLLLKGDGACGFAPFEGLAFEGGDGWTTAFSAMWEQGALLPTLAFGDYVDRGDPDGPFEACAGNALHRPTGARYGPPSPLEPGFCALSMLFTDWGRSGRADLRISNDRHYYVREGAEQLWAMEAKPRLMTEVDGWRRLSIWGMGIASRDLDFDGRPEVYLTSMADQILQSLAPGDAPTYESAPFERGHTAHRPHSGDDGRPSTGWHAAFGDVDNDGRDDLFVAKGNVDQMPTNAMEDPNSLLLQTAEGRFEERSVEAGVASPARSRGAALVDLNLDGRLDLAVVNRRAPMEIYENTTPSAGGWLLLRLRSPGPNVDALGSWVEVKAGGVVHSREIVVGGGHAGGDLGWLHFGLGDAEEAEMRVIWPGGEASDWVRVAVGRRYLAFGGAGGLTLKSF